MESLDRAIAALEAATRDPASPLHFTPLRLRARVDGWSPERQRRYVAAIAATGRADRAAALVGMSEQTAGRLRRRPGAESFADACSAAFTWAKASRHSRRSTQPLSICAAEGSESGEAFSCKGSLNFHKYRTFRTRQAQPGGPPLPWESAMHSPRFDYGPAAMTDPQTDPLVQRAREAALGAYAPYSRFSVGCAVESTDGEVVTGSNMENACYRLGVCAEIAALTAASQAFGLGKVARIAVAGGRVGEDGTLSGAAVVSCCGGCRQSILEAGHVARRDIEVVSSNGDGSEVTVLRISELLPLGFGPANLEDAGG